MVARKDLNLEWLEIAGQARNDGGRGNERGQLRQGLGAAGAEPPPYGGTVKTVQYGIRHLESSFNFCNAIVTIYEITVCLYKVYAKSKKS